jgi:hypothetical protein
MSFLQDGSSPPQGESGAGQDQRRGEAGELHLGADERREHPEAFEELAQDLAQDFRRGAGPGRRRIRLVAEKTRPGENS